MVTRYGPLLSKRHKKVESIPRRATELINELKDKPYEERLRELELPSLVYRRRRGDMILMFKVINGLLRVGISVLAHSGTHSGTQEVTLGKFTNIMR